MVEEFTAKEDGAQVPQPNDGVDSGSTAALNGMSQSEVGCEAQKDGGNAEHAVLSTTATTSVSTLSLNKTSEKSLDLGMEERQTHPSRSSRFAPRVQLTALFQCGMPTMSSGVRSASTLYRLLSLRRRARSPSLLRHLPKRRVQASKRKILNMATPNASL